MLDLNTLRLIAMVNFAGFAFVTIMLWRLVPQERSMRDWATGPALLAVAMLLLGMRGTIPNFISIVIANVLVTLGIGYMHQGAQSLFGLTAGGLWKWLAAGATLILCIVAESPSIRIAGTSLLYIPFFLSLAWLFWRNEEDAPLKVTKRIASLVFAAGALLFMSRAMHPPVIPLKAHFVATPSFLGALPYLYSILISLWISLTLMLIVGIRLQFQRTKAINLSEASTQALKESEEKFRSLFESTSDAVQLLDEKGFFDCNRATLALFGCTDAKQFCSLHPADLSPAKQPNDEDSATLANQYIAAAMKDGSIHFEWIHKRFDTGETFPAEVLLSSLTLHGKLALQATVRDITKRKQIEEQVRQLAFYDTLTGLPNRRLLDDRMAQTLAASKRSNLYGAVMFLDLDNFKPLNDTYGHAIGDQLLAEAGKRLSNCVREIDTVARFGGDEFVVMLSELNIDKERSISQARFVADKLLAALSEPYRLALRNTGAADTMIEHRCTASVGAVIFHVPEDNQEEILKQADAAMYQAKEAGRNQVRFHE